MRELRLEGVLGPCLVMDPGLSERDWVLLEYQGTSRPRLLGTVQDSCEEVLVGSAETFVEPALQPGLSLGSTPLLSPINLPTNVHLGLCFPGEEPARASIKCMRECAIKGRRERGHRRAAATSFGRLASWPDNGMCRAVTRLFVVMVLAMAVTGVGSHDGSRLVFAPLG